MTKPLKPTPALQARSQRSEMRILDATERLLDERVLDGIAMQEIAVAAGMSVGGVYARFPSKEVLLHALHARYERDRTALIEAAMSQTAASQASLDERYLILAGALIDLFRSRRGVLRTFVLKHWANREGFADDSQIQLRSSYHAAEQFLLQALEPRLRDKAAEVIAASFSMMVAFGREHIVLKLASTPGALDVSDSRLAHMMARMGAAFVRAELGEPGL